VLSSDLPGVNPATYDKMVLYYCLMTKVDQYKAIVRYFPGRVATETSFNIGNLVLRCIQKTDDMHKLSSPWEGPFIVTKVISPSTYRLQWGDGQGVPNPWNVEHLRRFYL
jgi:hypothetical protein